MAPVELYFLTECHCCTQDPYQASLMFLDINGISIEETASMLEITVKAAEGTTNIKEIIEVLKSSVQMKTDIHA
ncbi:MAG: hypothetical protein H0U75_05105 [Legionella sp.]|nr:hypothetical protein [Legionella sp.]